MFESPRVGVGVIITRNEQVLLLKRKNVHGSGSWSTPGGHLDFGESPEECAIREAKEEADLDITKIQNPITVVYRYIADFHTYLNLHCAGREKKKSLI